MDNTRFIHFSAKQLGPIRSVVQRPDGLAIKPRGLWFSVEGNDDGWRSWCEGEKFGIDRLAVETEIVLALGARILRIGGAAELDDFTARFRRPEEESFSLRLIDWNAVAAQWQGIIIAPYIWSRRLHDDTSWYYGWDCASGCIWDAAAIAEARQFVPVEGA